MSSRGDKAARLRKLMARRVMGRKTGYAAEEADAEAGAIETAAAASVAELTMG